MRNRHLVALLVSLTACGDNPNTEAAPTCVSDDPQDCIAEGEQACDEGDCEAENGKADSAASLDVDGDGVLRIDAVLDHPNGGKAYFFLGSEYIRYDLATDRAEPGYPRPIAGNWQGLFTRDIDAAVRTSKTQAHFFSGSQYTLYDLDKDKAAAGYPVPIADAWPGLWSEDIDAALNPGNGKIYFFKGAEYIRWDIANRAVDEGFPALIVDGWPGLWAEDIDAALWTGSGKIYFFSWDEYLRYDWARDEADDGYPLNRTFNWPGLWDIDEGSGRPGARLPTDVAELLREYPSATEIAARKARVALSAGTAYRDLSPSYPRYVASIEDRLGAYGCGLLQLGSSATYRFRCATHTAGPMPLDIAPLGIVSIDWQNAAYHHDQVSQGDFMASAGTPLSVFGTDDDIFYIHSITANQPTGSIVSGLNIKVRFKIDGVEKIWGFSHLNTAVPSYAIEAWQTGTPLTAGTVFGFIGYTGNLWTGTPPASDGPYVGNGRGLPASHSHIWFATDKLGDDLGCHEKLPGWARRVLDFSATYPFGGG